VTPDEVPIEEFTLKLDAKRGFLLGKLELGANPNFLILNGDPREDFDILLDTKSYANFAVEDGQIVRNRLLATAEVPTAEEMKQAGEVKQTWLAYLTF
jgi:phosphate-selective porin OprO/OprP